MQIIAITKFHSRVSSRLDCTQNIDLIYVENHKISKWEHIHLTAKNPLDKINTLKDLGVEVVICGGITEICLNQLKNDRIDVYPWVRGEIQDVVQRFLKGTLQKQNGKKPSPSTEKDKGEKELF